MPTLRQSRSSPVLVAHQKRGAVTRFGFSSSGAKTSFWSTCTRTRVFDAAREAHDSSRRFSKRQPHESGDGRRILAWRKRLYIRAVSWCDWSVTTQPPTEDSDGHSRQVGIRNMRHSRAKRGLMDLRGHVWTGLKLTSNQKVAGSSPAGCTNSLNNLTPKLGPSVELPGVTIV